MLLAWNYFIFVNPIELKCFPRWVILHGLQCIILALVENGRNVFFTGYCLLDVLQPLCCWKIFETPCAKRTAQPRGFFLLLKDIWNAVREAHGTAERLVRWWFLRAALSNLSDSEILMQRKLSKGSNR